jgi:phosphoribosyl 1,2-cyclic phosphodiesterase
VMSLFVASLNSGSNGNCFYIGNQQGAILVDAGISCREIEKRMKRLRLSIRKVKAVFISHEHSDHIRGIETLSKKFKIPVFINQETLKNSGLKLDPQQVRFFHRHEIVEFEKLQVTVFPKFHDATDPCSFMINNDETRVGIFTDLGFACEHVIAIFKQCHAAFLEANYDEEMLEQGTYPFHLKKRISGDRGHLSNKQALELFLQHRPRFMSHLFLSHISKNNNHPDIVRNLFETNAGEVKIIIASRYKETPLYNINNHSDQDHISLKRKTNSKQLTLNF